MINLPILILLGVSIAFIPGEASADTRLFLGNWRHAVISESEVSTLSCRKLIATTRRYVLAIDPGGTFVHGTYGRATNTIWVGPTNGCENPPSPTDSAQRADWWAVRGSINEDGQLSLVGEFDRCLGTCAGEEALQSFSTELSVLGDKLLDTIEETNERLEFIADELASEFEAEASERLFHLLRPLSQKSCTAFIEESMDPQASANLPRTEFCMIIRRLADLLSGVVADQPVTQVYFHRARFFNSAQSQWWTIGGGENVLVERLMVVDGKGNGVLLASNMRRQPNGEWKILSLMF